MTNEELEEFEEFKKFKLAKSKNTDSDELESNNLATLKQKASALLEVTEDFKQGDIVKWKKGLKNRKYPRDNQPCYVMEVLEKPDIQNSKDSGSPYYKEPLDLVLALLGDDSELLVFHYDKRRFKRANE